MPDPAPARPARTSLLAVRVGLVLAVVVLHLAGASPLVDEVHVKMKVEVVIHQT